MAGVPVKVNFSRAWRPVVTVALVVGGAVPLAADGAGAQATSRAAHALPCVARVSNPRPAQYSTVLVAVRTRPSARVTTIAYYRTTSTEHSAVASRTGQATVAYWISRATRGYTVIVRVGVRSGSLSGHCTTSFTTR